MRGFFEKEDVTQLPYKSDKGFHSCTGCGLYKYALSPRIKPYGNFGKGIMIVGEAPGEDEDRRGRPWQGKMGRVLQRAYKRIGIDIFEDCISLNAINCRPTSYSGANRPPNDYEIACCRQNVLTAIKRHQPRVIILHGNAAVSALIGYKWKKDLGGITKWRGWTIPDREFNAWVCPTYHPSYIARQESDSEIHVIWERDLKQALTKLSEPLPAPVTAENVIISHSPKIIKRINEEAPPLLAFDIESTGLKPYNTNNHEIICISFCGWDDKAYAMPAPSSRAEINLTRKLLQNPGIGKIAANMKFEDHWMSLLYNFQVRPWAFDTMLSAHVLDNRPGITGLKFQAFVRFGIVGYDDETAPYLKSSGGAYGLNRIKEISEGESLERLMTYCGMDSLLTYKLAKLQMEELGYKWK